jgi:hypothetical protein
MQETVFISLPLPQLQTLIIDCVNACLDANKPTSQAPPSDPIHDIGAAAKFLGVTEPTMYGLNNQRRVKYFMQGRKCYYFESDLIAYIRQGEKKTALEVATEAEQYLTKRKGGSNGK